MRMNNFNGTEFFFVSLSFLFLPLFSQGIPTYITMDKYLLNQNFNSGTDK